jgi:hypothetical protein
VTRHRVTDDSTDVNFVDNGARNKDTTSVDARLKGTVTIRSVGHSKKADYLVVTVDDETLLHKQALLIIVGSLLRP